MEIEYRLFKSDVVREGQIYFAPIGGFSLQPTRIFEIDKGKFYYRNERFTSSQDFNEPLDGMLEVIDKDKILRYVNKNSLETLRLLGENVVE